MSPPWKSFLTSWCKEPLSLSISCECVSLRALHSSLHSTPWLVFSSFNYFLHVDLWSAFPNHCLCFRWLKPSYRKLLCFPTSDYSFNQTGNVMMTRILGVYPSPPVSFPVGCWSIQLLSSPTLSVLPFLPFLWPPGHSSKVTDMTDNDMIFLNLLHSLLNCVFSTVSFVLIFAGVSIPLFLL